jgi:hypothetical protein
MEHAPRDCFGQPVTGEFDWSVLPDELQFLAEPAIRYGGLQFEAHRKRFWRVMTSEQRDELAALGTRVAQDEIGRSIDAWQIDRDGPEAARVGWLMATVYEFQRKNAPHSAHPLGLDWSKLPKRLSYFIIHAEACAQCNTDAERRQLMSEIGYEHLKLVGESLNATKDRELLKKWAQKFPPAQHRESAIVLEFVRLLDDYFPPLSFGPY